MSEDKCPLNHAHMIKEFKKGGVSYMRCSYCHVLLIGEEKKKEDYTEYNVNVKFVWGVFVENPDEATRIINEHVSMMLYGLEKEMQIDNRVNGGLSTLGLEIKVEPT